MDKIKVKVNAKTGTIWEGEGDSCSLINHIGPFDVLSEHTQFVTPIQDNIIVRSNNRIVWEYKLAESSLCRIKSNLVEIWVGV